MKKKVFYRWLKVFILLYSVIGIAVYYLQDKIVQHPEPVSPDAKLSFSSSFTELNIPYDKSTNLNIVQFHPADSPKGVVLYFHGNGGNINRWAAVAGDFTSKGYDVWIMDYPGYGKTTGRFTEKNLYAYALVEYKLARARYAPDRIILYGRSLGSAVAAQLASIRDCKHLILESPFYSMTSLFRRYLFLYPVGSMLHYSFPTYEYLPGVAAPITIFHGTSDGTVPYSNGERLKPLLKQNDEFVAVEGGGHNDLGEHEEYKKKLAEILHD